MPKFSYTRPGSMGDALRHLTSSDDRVLAGGTDLLGCLRDGVFGVSKVVSLSGIEGLRGISEKKDGVRLGALATVAEIEKSSLIKKLYPGLSQAAAEVASPQLRNQGTVGGNLCQKPRCWYYRGEFHCLRKGGEICFAEKGENQYHCILGGDLCYIVHPSDLAPSLVSLGATVHIEGPNGKRAMPVEKFHVPPGTDVQRETFLEPGEVVTEIHIPKPGKGLRSSYRKVRARRSWDFALAGTALALDMDGDLVRTASIVLSGAAPIPWRAVEAEEEVTGKRLDASSASRAAEAAMSKARPLVKNGYKVHLFKGLIEESLMKISRV